MKQRAETPHIAIVGKRNAGKSSLINFLTGQDIAIVSPHAGTTTDPVKKTMEIKGIGPIVWIDTAGIDDIGSIGTMRIQKSLEALKTVDLALILFSENTLSEYDISLVELCKLHKIPFILIHSKSDIQKLDKSVLNNLKEEFQVEVLDANIHNEASKDELISLIQKLLPESSHKHRSLLGDVLKPESIVLLVTPIDSSAPEGRLILPQVQTIRDILDNDSMVLVCKEHQLKSFLTKINPKPDLVITDSQVFGLVNKIVPQEIPLTSFSILLARSKGFFDEYVQGTQSIASLNDNDRILILESCTHHASCEDIGRVKLPQLLRNFTQKELQIDIVPGLSPIQRPIQDYALVIQCGGCVVTKKQLESRLQPALDAHIPVSNYGMAIAYMTGIFERSVAIFT
ncbi:[FeFe] hydrogenase H-cluster maturation GTPase HydF [Bacteroidales bacterium OttesenSCG-928-C19]|nr:[FeFe] hydrogenase H-cluster maturation GTPase HydF [Bacteroidales bacterium OttesenSCG-928-C19]